MSSSPAAVARSKTTGSRRTSMPLVWTVMVVASVSSPVRGPTFRSVAAAAIAVAVAGHKAVGSALSGHVPTSCRHVR